MIVPEFASTVG